MLQTVPIILQQDPAFHTHGNSTYIMTVRSSDYSTDVYCDGEMRIHVWDSAQAMRNGERHTSVSHELAVAWHMAQTRNDWY